MIGAFVTELRRAARRLARARAFSIAAVLTLAIGLGGTVAMLSLVNAVLIQPLPYPRPDRLVAFHVATAESVQGALSENEYLHFSQHSRTLEDVGAYVENVVTLTDGERPERVPVALVTPTVFTALGALPLHGRLFATSDAQPGASRVVVLSHGLWVRRFGADAGIVGRTIELNRTPFEVAGVMRPGLAFPRPETQLWYCLVVEPTPGAARDAYLRGLARLKPDVSVQAAGIELDHQLGDLLAADSKVYGDGGEPVRLRAVVRSLKDYTVADARRPLWTLLCAVGFVLLVAWANVANLCLVRAESRRGELAVHVASGATPANLVQRFLAEGLLLSGTGCLLALPLAHAGIKWHFGFGPNDIPRLGELRLDATTLALTAALTFATACVLGLAGLWHAVRLDAGAALTSGANFATSQPGQQRVNRALVGVQFGLGFVLLVGSVLMVQSFWRLRRTDLGFDPAGIIAVQLSLPGRQYPTYRETTAFYDALLESLRARPGILDGGAVSWLPLTVADGQLMTSVVTDGPTTMPDRGQKGAVGRKATVALATPAYFDTMRIRFVEGRHFEERDLQGDVMPVVLSAPLNRTLFGAASATGHRVRLPEVAPEVWYTVVGVAASVAGESIAAGPAEVLYLPVTANTARAPRMPLVPRDMTVVLRATLPPAGVMASVRESVRGLDPALATSRITSMDEVVAASTARTRLAMVLLLISAVAAVVLAIVGIYGVLSYTVHLRSRELGMRLVLGASRRQVALRVLRDGILVALAGVAGGMAAALVLARTLEALVFGVSPTDPFSYLVASALLLIVSALASYLPARRAGMTDPLVLLRVR